jgi:hypothetical protein
LDPGPSLPIWFFTIILYLEKTMKARWVVWLGVLWNGFFKLKKNPKKCQDKKGLWWCGCCSSKFPTFIGLFHFGSSSPLTPQEPIGKNH